MSKHTEGPWFHDDEDRGCEACVYDGSGNHIARCASDADARFIAALPEMFEMLYRVVDEIDHGCLDACICSDAKCPNCKMLDLVGELLERIEDE